MGDEKESTTSRLITGLSPLVWMAGISFLVGFVFILASRLFLKITKLPSFTESCLVGWAILWIWVWCVIDAQDPKHLPKKDNGEYTKGYDFDIIDNKIIFSYPPKGKLTADWTDDWPEWPTYKNTAYNDTNFDPTLYVHGETDGKNKVFYLSESPDKIIPRDFGEGYGLYVSLSLKRPSPEPSNYLSRKPRHTWDQLGWLTLWHVIFVGLGVLSWISAQLKAFAPDETQAELA